MKKKKCANLNSTILEVVGAKPILFNPVFARVSGDIPSAIFIGQMLYWQSTKGSGEWFYKTVEELYEETTLTGYQQRRAIAFWSSYGAIETEVRGTPPKRYFRTDMARIIGMVNTFGNPPKQISVRKNGSECFVPNFDQQ